MPAYVPQRQRFARAPIRRRPSIVAPWDVVKQYHAQEVPDPIEFIVSDKYLDRGNIYPRQGTLIKIVFLRDDLFTQYDHDVIGEWIETFSRTGNEGIQPDIYDRIRINKERGRKWFREALFVGGRRGSKGHLGALCGSYVLWNFLSLGDPQGYFGVDRDKRLTAVTFAGKKDQAKANQWRDITNVILGAPCFAPFISRPQTESLSVFAPHDFVRMQEMERRGVYVDNDMATFEIIPKESTVMAGRGPTSFMQHYDEMAHIVATGAIRSAGEVYNAATPALDQFGNWGFIYEGSSPWTQLGQFFENWERSLEVNDDGTPAYPEMFMVQFPSWALYEDWERARIIPLRPARRLRLTVVEDASRSQTKTIERMERDNEIPHFRELRGAIQAYDENMQQLERANPDNFKVERRAHWAAALDAYLDENKVRAIFHDWNGLELERGLMVHEGALSTAYKAHGDPSKSGANFGFAIGHTLTVPTPWISSREDGAIEEVLIPMKHVVFDVLHAWKPEDYEDHQVDYIEIEGDFQGYLRRFMPFELTFDQFNSVGTIGRLKRFVQTERLPKRIDIYEKTATAPLNWKRYETFKTAVNLGLVHAPYFELAELELRFLQDLGGKVEHPTSGPVQTKDVADCMAEVVHTLLGSQIEEMQEMLGRLQPGMALPGGTAPYSNSGANPYGDAFSTVARMAGGATMRGNKQGRPGTFRRGQPESWRPSGPTRSRRR